MTFCIASSLITWGSILTKLTCKHVLECFGMCLGANEIRIHELNDLVHQNANSG